MDIFFSSSVIPGFWEQLASIERDNMHNIVRVDILILHLPMGYSNVSCLKDPKDEVCPNL
jgi:hypothetical protein